MFMNIFYIALFSLTGTLLLLVVITIPVLVMRNIRCGQALQTKVEGEVSGLRLGRMLGHRLINVERYLRRERTVTILKHTMKCKACSHYDTCDISLQKPPGMDDDTSFCPNHQSLLDISSKY